MVQEDRAQGRPARPVLARPALLRAGDEPASLPVQLTSFIGREHELAELRRLLAETRLLTLTGSGGVGKTRLALRLATDVLGWFADAVSLVELAALSAPSGVPRAVTSALGLLEQAGRQPWEALADFLRPGESLLVLDNCEHLGSACAQLAERLLTASPELRILATSRDPRPGRAAPSHSWSARHSASPVESRSRAAARTRPRRWTLTSRTARASPPRMQPPS